MMKRQIINTNEEDHMYLPEIYVPTIKIYDFEANESLTNSNPNSDSNTNTNSNSNTIFNSNSNSDSISSSNSNSDLSLNFNLNANSNSNEGLINTILSINVNSKVIPNSEQFQTQEFS